VGAAGAEAPGSEAATAAAGAVAGASGAAAAAVAPNPNPSGNPSPNAPADGQRVQPAGDNQRTWRMMLKDLERIAMAPWRDAVAAPSFTLIAAPSSTPVAEPNFVATPSFARRAATATVDGEPLPGPVRVTLVRVQKGQSFGLTVADAVLFPGQKPPPRVSSIEPGGIAEAAGLRVGDCIETMDAPLLGIRAVKVQGGEHMRDLLNFVEPGVECTLTATRVEAIGVAAGGRRSVATQAEAVAALVQVAGLSAEVARAFVAPRWREGVTSVDEIVDAYWNLAAPLPQLPPPPALPSGLPPQVGPVARSLGREMLASTSAGYPPSTSTPTATPDSSAAQGGYPADSSADMHRRDQEDVEYFQLVTQLSQAQAAAFVLDMRRPNPNSNPNPSPNPDPNRP